MDITKLEAEGIKPSYFWKEYVSQRQPVVLRSSESWKQQFIDDFLLEKVGNVPVMVEHRASSLEGYGQGRKVPMQMQQLITAMQHGNTSLYMSTQEVGVSKVDGHPLLYGSPLLQLVGCWPLQQPLMGQLVPQSVNMWMGCAPEGASTGLHHDFHDNLYVLLRGCKRFRLFPPNTAPDMYVRGTLKHIFPNGRIVYEGQGDVNADGSDAHDVKVWQAHVKADAAAAAAAAAAAGPEGQGAAEAMLEQQLEHMLDEAADGADMDDYMEDDSSNDSAALPASSGCDDDVDDEVTADTEHHWDSDGSAACGVGEAGHTSHFAHSKSQGVQVFGSRPGTPAAAAAAASRGAGRKVTGTPLPAAEPASAAAAAEPPPPPSFSLVDLSLPEQQLRQRFPRFPGVSAALEVVLQAGDMLYLPAGWFHEVTSYGAAGLDGGHLAINYWYHPPDNLDSSKQGFKQPYTNSYWPTLWAQRKGRLHQETLDWWQHKMQQQDHHHQHQQHQHQHQQGMPAGKAAAPVAGTRPRSGGHKRRVQWSEDVQCLPNKYHVAMTKEGSATGSVHMLPCGSGQGSSRPCVASVVAGMDSDGSSETESPAPCSTRSDGSSHPPSAAARGCAANGSDLAPLLPSSVQEPPLDGIDKGRPGARGRTGPQLGDAGDAGLSRATLDSMAALDSYFSDNTEAMNALLAEFLAQRRRRLAASAPAAGAVALPRLAGRRHHYTVTVKLVPRRPARQN